MALWRTTLAYDGTAFHGWQVQPGLPTVQGTLSAALARVSGERVLPQGSGRTDTGVHALGQVASFALSAPIPPANLHRALNRVLPPAVRVLALEHAPQGFHARHSARRKTYQYRVFARLGAAGGSPGDRICPPFLAPYVLDYRRPLLLARAQAAAAAVVGEHDFTSFAASDPDASARAAEADGAAPKSNIRRIERSGWHVLPADGGTPELLVYEVTGSGFLHHMVRNLVGTFLDCGTGRLDPDAISRILAARDRSAAGPTAPARGLFLHSVSY